MAGIRAGSVVAGPFRRAREGSALVLSPGICHVRHRTALLSQLVTRIARGYLPPRPLSGGRSGGGARGSAAGKARARRTAAKKQPQAFERHEGCLQNELIARARGAMRTCAGWIAPAPLHSMRGPAGSARTTMSASGFGLFDPALEKASCGVGFIADIKGRKSHKIVEDALTILVNLEHRGAVGADASAGDGAGILVQMPHKFFAKKAAELGFKLPAPGAYAVGALFLPHDATWRQEIMDNYTAIAAQDGMKVLGWRDVPTDNSTLGESVKPTEPVNKQVFIARNPLPDPPPQAGEGQGGGEDEFERRLYILRKTISGIL